MGRARGATANSVIVFGTKWDGRLLQTTSETELQNRGCVALTLTRCLPRLLGNSYRFGHTDQFKFELMIKYHERRSDDPGIMRQRRIYGLMGDVEMARVWYEKASEFGSQATPERLELLAKGAR